MSAMFENDKTNHREVVFAYNEAKQDAENLGLILVNGGPDFEFRLFSTQEFDSKFQIQKIEGPMLSSTDIYFIGAYLKGFMNALVITGNY